jgi:hypothetical protein
MANHIRGLDHAVIAVRDLARAAETFGRLGFALTPKGVHAEWGTANHCIMFGQDYIALQAAEGEGTEAEKLRNFTAEREGMIGIAVGSDNGAAAIESLRRAGLDVPDPASLSRKLSTPRGTATLMFSEALLPVDATPGVRSRLVQHITAERERFPEWTQHPNGAFGIATVTAIVEDPAGLTTAWDRVFGPHSAVLTDETVTVHTGRGLVFLTNPDDLTQLHPEAELDELPAAPALVALALQVADTGRTAELLARNGVAFSRDAEGTIRIPPSEAHGVYIEMVGS